MSSTEAGALRGLLLPALCGALLALAYPLANLEILAFVALTPLLLCLDGASHGAALARGYAAGASFFLVLLYWLVGVMVRYGGLPLPAALLFLALLVFYLATYVALFAAGLAALWRRAGPSALIASPILWVGLEIVRAHALGGFPWGLLGYSQTRNLPLLQSASLGGIYAVSFLVMAANAGLALLLSRPVSRGRVAAGLALLALAAGAHVGGLLALRSLDRAAAAPSFPVAAIQANVPQDLKWRPEAGERIVAVLADLTTRAAGQGARLVVWPESSSPLSFRRPGTAHGSAGGTGPVETDRAYTGLVTGLARNLGIALIVGSVDYREEQGSLRAFNSAFAVGPDGTLGPSYDKVHLVPFGEYVPLRRLLFFVNRMVQGAIAEFAPGTRMVPLPTPVGEAATVICYEAIFPELVRRATRHAVVLVNITNDAWFGRSAAPEQHLAMAAVRAVENRIYLVRAANTGISAIVDPAGRIVRRTDLLETAVLTGAIEPLRERPLYARAGDGFAWACAIFSVVVLAAPRAAFPRSGT
jgi:apolipoprotein N-acyltransferase